ncbi:MAG TPA: sialidase family protein [Candidatus Limnocylindrales bacterium]|nr:sialidase family protein [Candidatus Limnocylindrales bacterium]
MTTERGLTAFAVIVPLALALVPSARAQQPSPSSLASPPGAQVTTISPHAGFFDEPSIAINPHNPDQLVAAFQSPARVSYSQDAGAHWQLADGTSPTNYAVSGDVSVTYDILGHAILCYIAFDKLGTAQYWAHNATRNGIFVRRSLDGGKTWESNAAPIDEQPTRSDMPFEDKPYIVADNNPNSPYSGNLYVGWTEFSLSKTIILFSRSNDGGITWSPPFEISTHEGIPRDDNGAVEGFAAVAGPDGTLYAIWDDGGSIVLAVSRDGGLTFHPSHPILETPASYFKVEDVERSDGFPQIGVDPRTERLFVVWTDYRNGDVDVFCSTSRDRARTWSTPVRVNNDPLHNGADQFFQWLAVDPSDGSANVVFYDRRGDPTNKSSIIVLARSTDGGQTFANYAWTTAPFDAEDKFMGDYTGIAALNGRVYAAWTYGEQPESSTAAARRQRPRRAQKPQSNSLPTTLQVGSADFRPAPK